MVRPTARPPASGALAADAARDGRLRLTPLGLFLMVPLLIAPFPMLRGADTVPSEAQFELAACLLALLSGATLINRAGAPGRRHYVVLGCAFLVAASEDIVAAVAMLSDLAEGVPRPDWLRPGALVGRGILPALLFMLAPAIRHRAGEPDSAEAARDGRLVYIVMVLAAALTALCAMLPLPERISFGPGLGHPVDLLAAAVYAGALVALALEVRASGDNGTWWVALACGVAATSHLFVAFSRSPHDALRDLAEGYQLLAPALPILGLVVKPDDQLPDCST